MHTDRNETIPNEEPEDIKGFVTKAPERDIEKEARTQLVEAILNEEDTKSDDEEQ